MRELIKNSLRKYLKINVSKYEEPKPLTITDAVNTDLKTIFVSVPKTGSTTVRDQLKQYGTPFVLNGHLDIIQIREVIYVYLLKTRLRQVLEFPSINVPKDEDLRKEADRMFNDFFKFSAVRNPWARAVSIYYRREGYQCSDKITFEEFCHDHHFASDTSLLSSLHKNQIDWMTDLEGNVLMDYIYKVENFEAAIGEIYERTDGRIQLENLNLNKNPKSKSLEYRKMYNSETKKIIAQRFEKDIDVFKYTF